MVIKSQCVSILAAHAFVWGVVFIFTACKLFEYGALIRSNSLYGLHGRKQFTYNYTVIVMHT